MAQSLAPTTPSVHTPILPQGTAQHPAHRDRALTVPHSQPDHRRRRYHSYHPDQHPGALDLRWAVSYNEYYGPPRHLAYKLDTIVINQRLMPCRDRSLVC